jgi:hypothetical protein
MSVEESMQREASIVAGVVAAAAAVVGMFFLVPVIARALTDAEAEERAIALVPQNARAQRLAARIEKKAQKRLAHAEAAEA